MNHRECTKCGATLLWHPLNKKWEGTHADDCSVAGSIEKAAMPSGVRTVGDDETDFIGPRGKQEWRVTLQMGSPSGRFEEVLGVFADTEDGAILLAQESRLNIVGIIAEPVT